MKKVGQIAVIATEFYNMDMFERVEYAARFATNTVSKMNRSKSKEFCQMLIGKRHFSPFDFSRLICDNTYAYTLRSLMRSTGQNGEDETVDGVHDLFEELEELWDIYNTVVCDMDWIPVKIQTSRIVTHELVRHKHEICFMQESQRYVNYKDDVPFVIPANDPFSKGDSKSAEANVILEQTMRLASENYGRLIEMGLKPQDARVILPNCTATKILAYASPREWAYIFNMRCSRAADPNIRALLTPLREQMIEEGYLKYAEGV